MSGWENEQIRQMGKAVNEYSHVMSELAEAEEVDGKLIMKEPMKELCIGLGAGLIGFAIIWMVCAWSDGERGFGFWGGLMPFALGFPMFGTGIFYKVVLTSDTITKYSIFFGIPKRIRLKKVTRIVVVGGYEKIKLYIGKIRVLTLRQDTAGGCEASIEYFKRAGIRIEYKGHSKLYKTLQKWWA